MSTRQRMTAAQRRDQLLDVTRDLVVDQGFAAVSMEAVARNAGITRPVVYGHFAELGALLDAMLERESSRALSQLAEVLPAPGGDGNLRDRLAGAMEAYLLAVQSSPVTWRLALMPPDGAPELLRARIAGGRENVIAILTEVVRTAGDEGLDSPDPELTGRILSAVSDEASRLLLTDPERYPVDRLMRHTDWLLAQLL
ncbi:MAG: TetR/AcrR family transcriptional regulator, partial [Solirubrobacteraceae bacterium]|nr:TetR/AcrR family transcriptional regulator [Solirubrobacteraceae bacterium]